MKIIYFDNNMTARPSDKAVGSMLPFLTDQWGSPSSPHQMGQSLYPFIKEAYHHIYKLLGASEQDSFVFTSSGAEAVNHVILSAYFDLTCATGRNHFISSQNDEAPILMSFDRLEELGCANSLLPVNRSGVVTADILADAITPRTAMVSLSWANGLTGVIQPIEEIAALCKERGILLHLDATHVLGKLYFQLEEAGADFITFNGDQFHAPNGTGGLFIRSGLRCASFIAGGMEQGGLRGGPFNVPGLAALGTAAQEAVDCRDLLCLEVARLRNKLEAAISRELADAVIFFRDRLRLPNCTAIGFPGISNEALLFLLSRKGLCACIGGGSFQQIGRILSASQIDAALANSAISFSLSRETTEEEIDLGSKIIIECVRKLRKISGYGT